MDSFDIEALIEALETAVTNVQPQPMIGDDDSIFLTEWQEGYRDGIKRAIEEIKMRQR